MIPDIKNILESVITTHTEIPAEQVARNAQKEKELANKRAFPFAALLTADGSFDESAIRVVRVYDEASGTKQERLIRGNRTIPIELKIWGKNESQATRALECCICNMPQRWEYSDCQGEISITGEGHSDHMSNFSDKYISSLIVVFSMEMVSDSTPIPVFTTVVQEEGEING